MDTLEKRIREILESEGAALIDLVVANVRRQPHIKVFVDTTTGVTSSQLAHFSRKISEMMEQEGHLHENYRLDVSSPGVDRPLMFPWQYPRNIGRHVEIMFEENGEIRTVKGMLVAATEDYISLEGEHGGKELPFRVIRKATVLVGFS